MSNRPRILITRAIFPEVLAQLALHFDVDANQADELWTPAQLITRLQGKQGVLTTALASPWRMATGNKPLQQGLRLAELTIRTLLLKEQR